MTGWRKRQVIDMAREAGFNVEQGFLLRITGIDEDLERFAELVREDEREACAKVCDLAMLQNQEAINELDKTEHIAECFIQGAMTQLVKTSKAIRARGQA
jgi:hypothetical protein